MEPICCLSSPVQGCWDLLSHPGAACNSRLPAQPCVQSHPPPRLKPALPPEPPSMADAPGGQLQGAGTLAAEGFRGLAPQSTLQVFGVIQVLEPA